MKFKVGDRVAVYNYLGRNTGKISSLDDAGSFFVGLDQFVNGNDTMRAHPKQCRRLIKRPQRRVWISEEQLRLLNVYDALQRTQISLSKILEDDVEFVEVRKPKGK